jgi:hypothetical protein
MKQKKEKEREKKSRKWEKLKRGRRCEVIKGKKIKGRQEWE